MNKIFKASVFSRAPGLFFKNFCCFSRNLKVSSTLAKASTKNQEASSNNIDKTKQTTKKNLENAPKLSKTNPEYQKLEKLFSPEFDKELEKMIAKKMEEGKSDEAILSELLGKDSKNQTKIPNSDSQISKSPLMLFEEYKKEGKPFDSSLEKSASMLKEMEQTENILNSSEKKPLPELPLEKFLDKKRKWTENEKINQSMRMSISSDLVNLEMKKMIQERKTELERLEESKKPPVSIEKIKIESSLQSPLDSKMKEIANQDIEDSSKTLDIYVDKPKEGDRLIKRIKEKFPLDAVEEEKNFIEKFSEKVRDIDFDEEFVKDLAKEHIFLRKKLLEELAAQKARNEQLNKIKKIKKIEKELNENARKEDIDFQDVMNRPKKKEKDPYLKMYIKGENQIEENMQNQKTLKPDNPLYERFVLRTTKNVKNFLSHFFSGYKQHSVRITRGYKLCFIDIIPNNALTVFYIFWDLMFEETNTKKIMKNANAENFENDMEKLQESLNKSSGFVSGKLCQELGLKYAPDLRFYRYKTQDYTNNLSEELKKAIPDVVKEEIKEKAAENNVPPIIKKKDLDNMIDDTYDRIYRTMMSQMDCTAVIKEEKNKKKFDENGKRIRKNRDENGKRKKYKRKNKAEAFWNSS